jgi:nucleoside-diphosphate-sugar epimerase
MPAPELQSMVRWIVTGSSGFIGTHLCRLSASGAADSLRGIDKEPATEAGYTHIGADIRYLDRLRDIAGTSGRADVVFHLAASAEVLTPWPDVPPLLSSNLEGTYNVLEGLDPRLAIFASSSSIYGSAGLQPADPQRTALQPLCLYAASKMSGEMMVRDWVRESGNAAVVFRFGNVVGSGCRGLIPYLISHLRRYPEGGVIARLRGNGRLVRDYVPVNYVVRVLMAAAEMEWPSQSVATLNLGTGTGMTNRDVAEIVQQTARERGLRLDVSFDDPPGPGEASEVVLGMEQTVKLLGIAPPGAAEVRQVIADTVREALEGMQPHSVPRPAKDSQFNSNELSATLQGGL